MGISAARIDWLLAVTVHTGAVTALFATLDVVLFVAIPVSISGQKSLSIINQEISRTLHCRSHALNDRPSNTFRSLAISPSIFPWLSCIQTHCYRPWMHAEDGIPFHNSVLKITFFLGHHGIQVIQLVTVVTTKRYFINHFFETKYKHIYPSGRRTSTCIARKQ